MMKLSKTSFAIALGLGVASVGQVAVAQQATDQSLEKIEITGSAIRRVDAETPSPVQVITAEDLKRSGYTDVSDVLRNISANGAGSLSQSYNFAFAGGGAGVALRGLSVGSTLVLIDGHRMAPYPLSDDAQRSFVDVSSIPFDAVEEVQVLKDGASALYGSDAMAGVVNIILKKSYVGANISGEIGESMHRDGMITHVSGIVGAGDYATDGYNAFGTVEYRHQNSILVNNRNGLWNSNNPAAWQALGTNVQNLTPGAPNVYNGGSPFAMPSVTGVLTDAGQTTAFFLPGCTAAKQAAGGCTFSYSGLEIQPPTENLNLLGRYTMNLGDGWKSSTEASLFVSRAEQVSTPSGSGYPTGLVGIADAPGGVPSVGAGSPWVITVPTKYYGAAATAALGPTALLNYTFADVGNEVQVFSTNSYRLVQEFTGNYRGWDVTGTAGLTYADTQITVNGLLDFPNLQKALNSGAYIAGQSAAAIATHTPAEIQKIAPTANSNATDMLNFVSLHGNRDIAALPGGPLSLATGVEYTYRALDSLNGSATAAGLQEGTIGFAVGHQQDAGAFVEIDAPVVKSLEIDAAARFDHFRTDYGSGGSTTNPKLEFKWTPIKQASLRGTWGEGYRLPSPAEAGVVGAAFGANTTADPALCPQDANGNPQNIQGLGYYFPGQCAIDPVNLQTATPTLKPERSTNKTLGIILEPTQWLNASADYYAIKIRDSIVSGFELGGLQALSNQANTAQKLVRGQPGALLPASNGQNEPIPVGVILYNAIPYYNASETKTSGIDIDARIKIDLADAGKLTGDISFTHVINYNISFAGNTWFLAGTQGPSGVSGDTGNPRNKGVGTLTWERNRLSITGTMNYIEGWDIADSSAGQGDCQSAANGAYPIVYGGGLFNVGAPNPYFCKVANFIDYDAFAQYAVDKHLTVHLSVLNIFNKEPPLDISTYGGAGNGLWSTLHQAGAVGRFYTVGASYHF